MFDPLTARPREIEAYLREQVRKALGDDVENASSITSSHGSFRVILHIDKEVHEFNFRRGSAKKIAKAIRALAG